MGGFPAYDRDHVRTIERFYDFTAVEIRGDGRVTAEVRVLPRYRTGPFLRRYRDEAMQVLHYRYAPFSGRTRFSESVVLRMQLDDRLLFR